MIFPIHMGVPLSAFKDKFTAADGFPHASGGDPDPDTRDWASRLFPHTGGGEPDELLHKDEQVKFSSRISGGDSNRRRSKLI